MIRRIWPYLLLAALCCVLFFWRLGAVPLIGLDEGLYSECSREMLVSGDYVVPTCNGAPFFDKPPIGYWLQAASMRVFGVNSFAARLPSAVEELLLVGLVVFLGTRLFSRRVGLMAGFTLACSILTAGIARMAILDAAFALAIAGSLGAFLLAYTQRAPRWVYLVFWAAMGLSLMIKGPAGAVLILATVVVFLIIRKDIRALSRAMPLIGIIVCLAVALPWYVLVTVRTGGDFMQEFLIHQNVQRALGKDFQHNMPFWFYLPVYLVGFFPWSLFVPAALGRLPKHAFRQAQHDRKSDEAASVFLSVWIGVVFVVFTIFRSKLPSYIFPIYAPSALLVAVAWTRAVEAGELRSMRRSALAAMVVACLIGAAMVVVPGRLHEPIPGLSAALTPMGISLVAGCIAAYLMLALKRPTCAYAALCCGSAAFITLAAGLGLPIAARTNALPAMRMAREIARTNEPAIAYLLSPPQPQLGFYAGRPVRRIDDPSLIREQGSRLVIAQRDHHAGLPEGGKLVKTIGPYMLLRFTSN